MPYNQVKWTPRKKTVDFQINYRNNLESVLPFLEF